MSKAIQAAARLSSRVTAAAAGQFKYDDGFKKKWRGDEDGELEVKTVKSGKVVVGFNEDVAEEGEDEADLQMKVPSIELTIGGKKNLLTWNEAYNIADMLKEMVSECYYG